MINHLSKNMTNKETFILSRQLENIGDLVGSRNFAYAIIKNKGILKSYVEKALEKIKPSKELQKFDEERNKLAQFHAKKDENGKFMTKSTNGQNEYDIEDQKSFDKDFKALEKTYKKAINAQEKKKKDFDKWYDAESTVKLHLIDENDVPEEISVTHLEIITPLIK
jgi:hypothetical protein